MVTGVGLPILDRDKTSLEATSWSMLARLTKGGLKRHKLISLNQLKNRKNPYLRDGVILRMEDEFDGITGICSCDEWRIVFKFSIVPDLNSPCFPTSSSRFTADIDISCLGVGRF